MSGAILGLCPVCGVRHGHAFGCSLLEGERVDLDLLAKLASGSGGRRTGALKRAGYIDWTVTPAGLEALRRKP